MSSRKRIGTAALAREALTLREAWPLPDEWRQIGAGCFRTAYLHEPTNVVYKVEDYEDLNEPEYGNRTEVRNAKALMRDPEVASSKYIRIPLTTGWNVDGQYVVAMEYIPGQRGSAPHAYAKEAHALLRLGDMHRGNFRVHDGHFYPIDMGSTRHRSPEHADRRVLTA